MSADGIVLHITYIVVCSLTIDFNFFLGATSQPTSTRSTTRKTTTKTTTKAAATTTKPTTKPATTKATTTPRPMEPKTAASAPKTTAKTHGGSAPALRSFGEGRDGGGGDRREGGSERGRKKGKMERERGEGRGREKK